MNIETVRFELPIHMIDKIQSDLNSMQEKADKLGVGGIDYNIGIPYAKEVKVYIDMVGYKKTKTVKKYFSEVEITGIIPILNGWKFIASFDYSREFGMMINKPNNSDEVIPAKYLKDNGNSSLCEHCNTNRYRNRAYIIKNEESGDYKQVGSSCVHDFIGDQSVKALEKYWNLIMTIQLFPPDPEMIGIGEETGRYSLMNVILLSEWEVSVNGYISFKRSEEIAKKPTVEIVANMLNDFEKIKYYHPRFKLTDYEVDKAKAIIDWAIGLSDNKCLKDDYYFNMRNIARSGNVSIKRLGIAISIVNAYERYINSKQSFEGKEYYDGAIGDRVDFMGIKVFSHRKFDNHYGVSHLYKFQQGDNICLTWFSSRDQKINVGDTLDLKATIKKFNDYEGSKETVITRGKLIGSD